MSAEDDSNKLIVGLSIPELQGNACLALQQARSDGYNFVTTSLSCRASNTNSSTNTTASNASSRSDVLELDVESWRRCVVGQLDNKEDALHTSTSIDDACEWARHMNLPAVLLPPIPTASSSSSEKLHNYAAALLKQVTKANAPSFQLWVPIRLNPDSLRDWQMLYRMCGENHHIGAMLILEPLPTVTSTVTTTTTSAASVASSDTMITDEQDSISTNKNNNKNTMNNPANFLSQQMQLLHLAIGAAPIRAVGIPTILFLTNKRGYPTLAKSHQILVCEILKRIGRTVKLVLQGPSRHSIPTIPPTAGGLINHSVNGSTGNTQNNSSCLCYLQYLNHLRARKEVTDVLDSLGAMYEYNQINGANYLDALQRPLQPLGDHLENQTYDVFEKDPVKYVRYQEAVVLALRERLFPNNNQRQQQTSQSECVVFVVGAGRGPLVSCVLRAYNDILTENAIVGQQQQQQRPVAKLVVFAVEKNPSAVIYLQAKAQNDPLWKAVAAGCCVHIVGPTDMRSLTLEHVGGKYCDIVVSELLGSFGDNELSPECLDAFFATPVCKSDTVSIPARYTSHVSLVSSVELHLQARNQALYPNDAESNVIGMQQAMETPYVVRTHAASQTHEEQDCWSFVHPATANNSTNPDRSCETVLDFAPHAISGAGLGSGYGAKDKNAELIAKSSQDPIPPAPWTLTGLLGTFTATLYSSGAESSQISIAPSNFSVGMFSWFPLYFPLKDPVHVPARATVRVYMWRRADAAVNKVWYEWSVAVHRDGELLSVTPIHNPGGRSYHVSM